MGLSGLELTGPQLTRTTTHKQLRLEIRRGPGSMQRIRSFRVAKKGVVGILLNCRSRAMFFCLGSVNTSCYWRGTSDEGHQAHMVWNLGVPRIWPQAVAEVRPSKRGRSCS